MNGTTYSLIQKGLGPSRTYSTYTRTSHNLRLNAILSMCFILYTIIYKNVLTRFKSHLFAIKYMVTDLYKTF